MTTVKKITVGLALVATSLAVSVAQADQQNRRGGGLRDIIDIINTVDNFKGERKMRRLTKNLIQDLRQLKQVVRNQSRSQGMRGPARRALDNIHYAIQSARHMKQVVNRRGLVPRLQNLKRQTQMDIRQAVLATNRVSFVSRRGENRAFMTVDQIRYTMQKIQRVLNKNLRGRPGRDGRDRRRGRG